MATKILKPAVTVKICDMCGGEKRHFVNGEGAKLTVGRGYVQSQSDRWEKTITADVYASVPYQSCKDVCTDCLREAFNQMIMDIEND